MTPTYEQLQGRLIDVQDPDTVEIIIDQDGGKVWVNVGPICVFRACGVKHATLQKPSAILSLIKPK